MLVLEEEPKCVGLAIQQELCMCQGVQKALDGSSWLCLRIEQEAEQKPCWIIKANLLKPCFFFGTHYSNVGPRDLCVHRPTRLCQVYAQRGDALTPGAELPWDV